MPWSSAGTISLLTTNWQYTDPIEGEYFRFKHFEAPNGAGYAIAQAVFLEDGTVQFIDSLVLFHEKGVVDTLRLKKPEWATERRLGFKKFPRQPTFEEDLRRLLLPGFMQAPTQDIFNFVKKSEWRVDIEVSDYVEVEKDYTAQFADVTTRLTTIERKIDNINTSGGGTTPATDPNFGDVVVLQHFDTDFTDIKGHAVTAFGNVVISKAQSKFSGASALFDGDGDYLSFGSNADFDLSSVVAFTHEFFIRVPTTSGSEEVCVFSRFAGGQDRYFLNLTSARKFIFRHQLANGSSIPLQLLSSLSLPIDTWVHIALVKDSSTYYLFQDGQQVAAASYSSSLTSSGEFRIGGFDISSNLYANWLSAYLDEFRYSKYARYTADFTPPSQPFPNS